MTAVDFILAALFLLFVVVIFRQMKPELAVILALAAGALLLLSLLPTLLLLLGVMRDIMARARVDFTYVALVVKVVGLAYLAQFAADVARDAGETALAGKIELGGRVAILAAALPALWALMEVLLRLMEAVPS
ncbi:MAG: SpoIIIAC/SpoIIIAD family protein [Bacillota bacterium]|nr:SpoIIIAC/SpoIIIAD family protein [Bacillota bacterium]